MMKVWSSGFNVNTAFLSRASGFISSGNLSAVDIIGNKAHEIVGYTIQNTFDLNTK